MCVVYWKLHVLKHCFSPHSLCSPTAWHCSFGPPLPSSTVVTGVVLICFILSTYYSIYIYICSTCISYWIHVLPWEDTPETKADILYIYIYTEREREKGYREKERYRDKYCGRERIASYSCDHVTHYRGFVLHDCINMI